MAFSLPISSLASMQISFKVGPRHPDGPFAVEMVMTPLDPLAGKNVPSEGMADGMKLHLLTSQDGSGVTLTLCTSGGMPDSLGGPGFSVDDFASNLEQLPPAFDIPYSLFEFGTNQKDPLFDFLEDFNFEPANTPTSSTASSPASSPEFVPFTDFEPYSPPLSPISISSPAPRRHPHPTRPNHPHPYDTPSPKAKFRCTLGCSLDFSRKHDRLRHEVAQHGRTCEWECEQCGRFFSSEGTLKKHRCGRCVRSV
ncbi:hypothetical protein FB45DRAFT_927455 [Roridomyces roridus]|uniref:C2H2-type domain-containing protein n=1 Tax=Roridomyces roridus TaxID=1738132 RepID=A0AAD7BJ60_9AGAR|nr:hypothetical protein FB45DRAFT_927455 [Roridomyces roridus]